MAFFFSSPQQHRQRTAHFGSRDIILSPRSRGIRGYPSPPPPPPPTGLICLAALVCVFSSLRYFVFFYLFKKKNETWISLSVERHEYGEYATPSVCQAQIDNNEWVCAVDGGPEGLTVRPYGARGEPTEGSKLQVSGKLFAALLFCGQCDLIFCLSLFGW